MNKKTGKSSIDRESVRILAIELGVPEAARRLGLNRNTVHSWARRYNWDLPKRAGRPGIVPARDLHTKPGDVLIATHRELEGRTKTGLAQATAKASEHAAKQDGATNLNCSGKLRDLASAAARVFAWDADKPNVQFNQLVVTQEQLEQIRALRDS